METAPWKTLRKWEGGKEGWRRGGEGGRRGGEEEERGVGGEEKRRGGGWEERGRGWKGEKGKNEWHVCIYVCMCLTSRA